MPRSTLAPQTTTCLGPDFAFAGVEGEGEGEGGYRCRGEGEWVSEMSGEGVLPSRASSGGIIRGFRKLGARVGSGKSEGNG